MDKYALVKYDDFYAQHLFFLCLVYTFTDKSLDYPNLPPKVRKQFAVYGVLGTGAFGEVRLAFEKVSNKIVIIYTYVNWKLNNFIITIKNN